jgi:peptide deformylase
MRKVSQRGLKPFNDIQLYKWGDVCELMQTPRPPMKYMTKTHGRILENLKKFASMNGYCSLSANQIFERPRMFVCLNKAKLVPQKWTGYDNVTPDDYDGVVNPIPKELSVYEEYGYEECPSVPLFKFKVKRPIEGEIEWRDELNN